MYYSYILSFLTELMMILKELVNEFIGGQFSCCNNNYDQSVVIHGRMSSFH